MSRQDWFTSGVIALCVAAITVMLQTLPMAWAETPVPIAIPALPSTQLTIPTIEATVSAVATPDPGKAVNVAVTVKSPAGKVTEVPVTITITKTTFSLMSRSMPMPMQVAKVDAVVPIDSTGAGSASVALPLVWDKPAPSAANTNEPKKQEEVFIRTTTEYQMYISSKLGGQAAPETLSSLQLFNTVTVQREAQKSAEQPATLNQNTNIQAR